MYKPIEINRKELTIMGVAFPNMEVLDNTADAIGSNMFEGLEPTPNGIAIIRDFVTNKITLTDLIRLSKMKQYV
jgi:putative transcriptional regulator